MAALDTVRMREGENLSLMLSSFVVREEMAGFTEDASLCILMRRLSFKYHLKDLKAPTDTEESFFFAAHGVEELESERVSLSP
jgi:hypothetical protein